VKLYELKNLDRMAAYQIKIAAMTVNGTGPFSDWINVVTYENDLDESHVPGEPGWIRTKPSADSILVTWGAPYQQDIKVRAYVLGWGKGVPDLDIRELDENVRSFEIRELEPNSEYVIAVRARNNIGDGPPKYENTRTREDVMTEMTQPLEVPVGLRAIPMSGSSIVVYWTDTTLGKSQHVKDNRFYTVRYSTTGSTRFRYHNTTDLNCMIGELKPNTQYEFEVKVVKGRRESLWSMSVLNSTMSSAPASPPRDLTVIFDDKTPLSVQLSWKPPKHLVAQVSNYVMLYTTNSDKRDRDWDSENVPVPADKNTTTVIINHLKPHTTYYFKVQSKHGKKEGPFSAMVSHTTGAAAVGSTTKASNVLLTTELFYALVGGIILLVIIIIVVALIICCRKKPQETPEHKKQSYQKNSAGIIKPPDLWIHHQMEQMELKNIEKINMHQTTPGCSDGASSSGVMTLPRSVGHDFETESQFPNHVTNSLDKRTYVPGYMSE
jgi:neogenin